MATWRRLVAFVRRIVTGAGDRPRPRRQPAGGHRWE